MSELAGQYSISKSLEDGHSTILMNKLTGELVAHWVELDIRSEIDQPTILHIRTIEALEHNTPYVVIISGLIDESGELVPTPEGFAALRDQVITSSIDIVLSFLLSQSLQFFLCITSGLFINLKFQFAFFVLLMKFN